jgi:hypothetical protein
MDGWRWVKNLIGPMAGIRRVRFVGTVDRTVPTKLGTVLAGWPAQSRCLSVRGRRGSPEQGQLLRTRVGLVLLHGFL